MLMKRWLKSCYRYGKQAWEGKTPLTVLHGNIPNYLGITLGFIESGKVIVHMSNYVKNMLHDAPCYLTKT